MNIKHKYPAILVKLTQVKNENHLRSNGEVSNVFLFFFFLGKLWKLKNHRQCILVWLVLDLGLTL